MKLGTLLATASAIAIAVAGYSYLKRDGSPPPILNKTGEASNDGWIVKERAIDYESIINEALAERARLITLTVRRTVIRDEHLEKSIAYTPLPTSTARIRVKYEAEYSIGYDLGPGQFGVSGGAGGLLITLHSPQLVARPSVRLLSHKVLDSGYLIDEKAALLELQQRIQPYAEKQAPRVLNRADIIPLSEAALRRLLHRLLAKRGGGGPPPPITFRYR